MSWNNHAILLKSSNTEIYLVIFLNIARKNGQKSVFTGIKFDVGY